MRARKHITTTAATLAAAGLVLTFAGCSSSSNGGHSAKDPDEGASSENTNEPSTSARPHPSASHDAGGAAKSVVYEPVHVDFEDLKTGTVVTDQYEDHVSFSTEPAHDVKVTFNHNFGTGNYIQTAIVEGNTGPSLFVEFAKPVNDLKFVVLAANSADAFADVNIFQNGKKTDTVSLKGHGNPVINVDVDLSTYDQVTKIEIVNVTDFDNVAYDDFTFSFPE